MWDLDHKEGWVPNNWRFWIVVLEKILESPLDSKIKPVDPKGNQLWIFLQGLRLKLKLQYCGHLMWRANSLEKSDAWKDWGEEEKAVTEDEVTGWHHRLNGQEFEQTLGDSEGQGRPGVQQSMGSLRVRHDWVTEQQWTQQWSITAITNTNYLKTAFNYKMTKQVIIFIYIFLCCYW